MQYQGGAAGPGAAALLAALAARDAQAAPQAPATVVVAAHPDDEVVGAGSRLPRLAQARFIHLTDGAPRDGRDAARHGLTPGAYAALRQQELRAAFDLCGIPAAQVQGLGCADQEAALYLPELASRLADLFQRHGVAAVLTHPYEGGHPDHDATAFAVHAAVALLRGRGLAAPEVVEMTSYHLGPDGLRACEFLPAAEVDARMVTIDLGPDAQRHKKALLACFASQRETLAQFPTTRERFRPAPRPDFTQPPHPGALFYERHDWGMRGERFRTLAAQAIRKLGLEGAPWR